MRIEITSTLTQEDESHLASAFLTALSGLLDLLPIAYLIRVETTEHTLEHVSPHLVQWAGSPAIAADPARNVIES